MRLIFKSTSLRGAKRSNLDEIPRFTRDKIRPYNLCVLCFISCGLILLVPSLTAGSLKDENFRLRQEITMEEEASRLLGQKVIKAYEEIVILENKLKDKEKEIKRLEKELAAVRKLIEKESIYYRRKIRKLERKIEKLKRKK